MTADRFGIVGHVVASAYQVESVVAEGGFGVVYRAHHGGFRAPVALKCLKVPQHLARQQQTVFLEQFRAEAEVMFRLSASLSTVVRPLHVDAMTTPTGAFVPFMVLEWLEGETLDAIIQKRTAERRPPLELEKLIELLDPVAHALSRAHHFQGPAGDECIVHCDLKPENVFVAIVAGERTVKILDFGVAQVQRAATRVGADSSGVALFTPAYGAPEQWMPKELGTTGPFTNVWGLALTLSEALVGRPVISGTHQAVMQQVLDRKRRPTPRTHGALVGDAVEAVFVRALAVSPRDRYQDAGAFWQALRDAVQRPATAVAANVAEIPDLVPVVRRPSGTHKLELPGVHQLDFDGADGHGAALALDVAPDELVKRGSLAPLGAGSLPPARLELSPTSQRVPLVPSGASGAPPAGARSPALAVSFPPAPAAGQAPPGEQQAVQRHSTPAPSVPPSLARRLAPGLGAVVASIALTALDRIYASSTGEVFSLGPIKTSLVAGLLFVAGLVLVGRELWAER